MHYPAPAEPNTVEIYHASVQVLTGPAAIVAACGRHPVSRFAVGILASPSGFTHSGEADSPAYHRRAGHGSSAHHIDEVGLKSGRGGTIFFGRARDDGDTGFYLGRADCLDQLLDQAHSYANSKISRAEGDASHFNAVAAEYRKSPQVTSTRVYLEAMELVLPKLKKLVVDANSNLDLSVIGKQDNSALPGTGSGTDGVPQR